MERLALLFLLTGLWGCDAKNETVKQGREAVKEVVNQPFETLDHTKDSVQENTEKQKAALEEAERQSN
jgi:hypothetical protein